MNARSKIIRGNPEPAARFVFRCEGHLDDENPVRVGSRETVLSQFGQGLGQIY